jgi:hypothetical protein
MPPVLEAMRDLTGIQVLNQLDEALLSEIDRNGGLSDECVDRMHAQLNLARLAGSAVVLTTCNAYSITIMRDLRPRHPDLPIVVIDEAMVRRAVAADRVGVVATVAAGLESQREMFAYVAAEEGRAPALSFVLREDAFAALTQGNGDRHDEILKHEIGRLAAENDLVVLAQASMARVVASLRPELRACVLSSPELAAQEVRRLIGSVVVTGGDGRSGAGRRKDG